jgi:hypothetical protein
VDADLIRESFARGRAANLIDLVTAWKFDLFPLRNDEYSRTEFGRRPFREIPPDGAEKVECAVASGRIRFCGSWNGIAQAEKAQSGSGTICSACAVRFALGWMFFTCAVGPVTVVAALSMRLAI